MKISLSVLLLYVLKFPNVARLSQNVWKSIYVYLYVIAWLIYANKSKIVLNKFVNALVIFAIKFVIVLNVYVEEYINVLEKYVNKYAGVWKSPPWGSKIAAQLPIKNITKFSNINSH